MVEIIERLRLRVYQDFACGFDFTPLLEESSWELCRYSERFYRVAAANVEFAFEPLPGACGSRYKNEVSQLAQAGDDGGSRGRIKCVGLGFSIGCVLLLRGSLRSVNGILGARWNLGQCLDHQAEGRQEP